MAMAMLPFEIPFRLEHPFPYRMGDFVLVARIGPLAAVCQFLGSVVVFLVPSGLLLLCRSLEVVLLTLLPFFGVSFFQLCLLCGFDEVGFGGLKLGVNTVSVRDFIEQLGQVTIEPYVSDPPGKTSKSPLRASSLSHLSGIEPTSTVVADARSLCSALVR